jgi:hypothetical protein
MYRWVYGFEHIQNAPKEDLGESELEITVIQAERFE